MISEVYNIDCMEYMSTCKDKQFDLAIVDPIYMDEISGLKMGVQRTKFNFKNFIKTDKPYFKELFRVSKNQIIWGGNYFTDFLPVSRAWICWDKIEGGFNFSKFELAWTSFDKVTEIFRFCNHGGFIVKGDNLKINPYQKPIHLYKWLLKNYAKPGDTILDTHLGSQSSRIACYEGGFDFWGCELDKEYFDSGCKRFENYKLQLKLFLV